MSMKCQHCGEQIGKNMRQEAQFCSVECKNTHHANVRKLGRKYERALACIIDIEVMHKAGDISDSQYKTAIGGIRRAVQKVMVQCEN